jgi:hypothetical protein
VTNIDVKLKKGVEIAKRFEESDKAFYVQRSDTSSE